MPRHNYPSGEARKRIARELIRISRELDKLETELHKLWVEDRLHELGDEFGDEQPDA